ncbi:putative beta-lysine N-acetyltransferase [Bacillus seohaeanensis]|jgi:beta-lysine N6-acetyltransferase|uniref:Beta-lysine N-acetyltransferase n=1 Tax=Bacillus seohaeanensis TaxID=284580 RepID=A0ABW5RR24_9BACI
MQVYEDHQLDNASLLLYKDEYNHRMRVDDYRGNIAKIISFLNELSSNHKKIEKMIIKSRGEHVEEFLKNGYVLEAIVSGYFTGDPAYLVSKFFTNERRNSLFWKKEDEVLGSILHLNKKNVEHKCEKRIKRADKSDANSLAKLYQQVFSVYPVPLHKAEYIKKAIDDGTIFLYIEDNGEIISSASAEINIHYHNAELTDCATLPQHRKGGYMKHLLSGLEAQLKAEHIYCAYTIARALSYGMNAAFYQLGYEYQGRLANNCYIFDKMEDMNVWVKDLSKKQ